MNAKFSTGEVVRVRQDNYDRHHRTPWFVKGKKGRVWKLAGLFFNPESKAYGGEGLPKQPLYAVEFYQTDVWANQYRGSSSDTLLVDIYEHWLVKAN